MTTEQRIKAARIIAAVADAIQIPEFLAILPTAGTTGAVMVVTDLVAAGILMYLLGGWDWRLLPSFIAEQIPGLNLFPTWSLAVHLSVTRKLKTAPKLNAPDHATKP